MRTERDVFAIRLWKTQGLRMYGSGENRGRGVCRGWFSGILQDINKDMHNGNSIVLASGSATRLRLLRSAGVSVIPQPARIDEDAVVAALLEEGADPREMSTALAELKAQRISGKHPEPLVIGCDQVLEFDGRPVSKCRTPAEARDLLMRLRGRTHQLHSSAVVCRSGRLIWRHTATATITMKTYSEEYLDAYLKRNTGTILDSVGCYLIEEEGIRLIAGIGGDFFTVCGLPLLPLLAYLEDLEVLER